MNLEDLTSFNLAQGVWYGMEALVIVGLSLYIIFAFVVVRQVNQMTDTLEVGFEGPIRFAAWLHFLFALATLGVAIMIL